MDFEDSQEEAAYRAGARDWLEANAASFVRRNAELKADTPARLKVGKEWQALKAMVGYASITLPREVGGGGGTPLQDVIYRQEEARYNLPTDFFRIGLGMCIPTIVHRGTDAQRHRYAASAIRGDEVWCQLFSEPSAGSDLAGLRTRAARDGEGWVIDGQKVWTTVAHVADFGILLTRTDSTVPKHRGLTMFIVDMKAPGVEVRPIRQLSGETHFNEVFFQGVRVPDASRIGNAGDGWNVALATLMFERSMAGMGLGFAGAPEILRLSRQVDLGAGPAIGDQRIRERIADMWINEQALKLLSARAQTALSKGALPGPEQSINKVIEASHGQQAAYLAMDLLGEAGALTHAELGDDWLKIERSWTWGAAMRIAGGSDEILRNIIGERVLGLPGDIRPDKDVAFNKLKG
jgi:alkylation response protein AidB-like acyl-CoA dehydrogenase